MPYVTDEIYNSLPIKDASSIILSSYPIYNENYLFEKEENEIDALIDIITSIRNKKAENNIPNGFGLINNFFNDNKYIIDNNINILTKLLKCDIINSSFENSNLLDIIFPYGSLKLCYKGKEMTDEDKKVLLKEKESLENSIIRRKKLLSNDKYTNNAPLEIVNSERQKLQDEENKLKMLLEKLN